MYGSYFEEYTMRFKILSESRRRMRLRLEKKRMSLSEADLLETWLAQRKGIESAVVHERTMSIIVTYSCTRSDVISYFAAFDWQRAGEETQVIDSASRQLRREYEEKLVDVTAFKLFRALYFPAPLRAAYTAVRSIPYIWEGVKCIVSRKMRVELLDALSIGLSMVQGDFDTAGSVMYLLRVGEIIEEWTHKKSVGDLARSMSLNIDRVWLRLPEGDVLTPISQIRTGDLISVKMGSMVPLDGTIESGEVMVNQSSLTGESIPVPKREGMTLFAGTVVEEGECTLTVTKQEGSGQYDRIVSMIERTEKLKSESETRAASLADKLVPYSLAGSVLTYLITRNITRAMSVLMVDFSCALKLSMPLAVLSAMREASRTHITVKGGKFLEAVANADTVVFDKTGTLTHACPRVVDVVSFGGRSETEMLRIAACLEEHFPHSIANAVVNEARERGLSHEEMHSDVEYIVAHGIASSIEGERVLIGSAHFVFEDEGCIVPPGEQEKFDALPPQYSHLYLTVGGALAAVICIADPLRREAKDAINALRELGVKHVVMLTGDSERTAAAIAAQVGVDEYCSEVLPEDKAQYVEKKRSEGSTVIMIGDGINDSPALSAASVGIAISDGAAIAREIADVTIPAGSLFELVTLRRLSMELTGRIRSNYRFIIGFNGGLIGLGVLGVLQPATSALLHNVSTIAISLKSMTNLMPEEEKRQLP